VAAWLQNRNGHFAVSWSSEEPWQIHVCLNPWLHKINCCCYGSKHFKLKKIGHSNTSTKHQDQQLHSPSKRTLNMIHPEKKRMGYVKPLALRCRTLDSLMHKWGLKSSRGEHQKRNPHHCQLYIKHKILKRDRTLKKRNQQQMAANFWLCLKTHDDNIVVFNDILLFTYQNRHA